MINKLLQTGLRWLWISVVIIGIDRFTKIQAQQSLIPYDSKPVMPFFNLTLSYNKGAAFSFLSYAAGWQVWLFGVLAIVISAILIGWLMRISHKDKWIAIALTLIIGGALGNLWDRISYGHVIDFIDLYVSQYHWPVFNIADSAICGGAVMLIIDSLCTKNNLCKS